MARSGQPYDTPVMTPNSAEPGISVIIPVYNGGQGFRRCLASVAQASPAPQEVIVVADGDTDGSGEVAEEFGMRVLRTAARGGPARARNLGAGASRGAVLFFVDADVVIPSDAFLRISGAFKEEPSVAAVFGSYDDLPAETNFLSQYKNLFHHYTHQTAREEASTFWGASGAIRREIFFAVGGFDERYWVPSIEDIELGYRLTHAGYRIRVDKGLQVKHLKRWGAASLLKSDVLHRALPWTELILRDRRIINDLNLRVSGRLSVFLVHGLVAALVASWRWPSGWVVASVFALFLLGVNAPLYAFFRRKRGIRFAIQAVPWHWFFYWYSGVAFAIGLVRSIVRRSRLLRTGHRAGTRRGPDATGVSG